MVLKKAFIVGSLFAAFACGRAEAQLHTPSATFEHRPLESTASTSSLASPGIFNYDAQMFAPVEFTNNDELEPNCGFFFTFDKTLSNVSRSDRNQTSRQSVPVGNDWNWGERYQFGWMTEQDSGWHGSFQMVDGVYYAQGGMDEDFLFKGINADGSVLDGGNVAAFGDLQLPGVPSFGSDPASYSNQLRVAELNRVFRQALKNGDYFEPYLGGRFTGVNDESVEDNIYRYANDDTQDQDISDKVGHRFRQTARNSAFGFQAGARHIRRRGRWKISTDGALASSYNHQRYTTSDIFWIDIERDLITETYFEESSFVPTLDLDLGLSYNVTRDITIRFGAQLMYLWQGISRVNTLPADVNPNSIGSDPSTRDTRLFPFQTPVFDDMGLLENDITGLLFGSGIPLTDQGPVGIFDDSYIAAGFTFGFEWQR